MNTLTRCGLLIFGIQLVVACQDEIRKKGHGMAAPYEASSTQLRDASAGDTEGHTKIEPQSQGNENHQEIEPPDAAPTADSGIPSPSDAGEPRGDSGPSAANDSAWKCEFTKGCGSQFWAKLGTYEIGNDVSADRSLEPDDGSIEDEDGSGMNTFDAAQPDTKADAGAAELPVDCNGEIVFRDVSLEILVRRALGELTGPLTAQMVLDVKVLLWDWQLDPIQHLDGIQCLENLEILELHAPEISDIAPLSNLKHLNVLDLAFSKVTDLSPLSSLANLNYLDLGGSGEVDLAPLSSLVNLNVLIFESDEINDLTPISSLVKLNILHLESSQIIDIGPLSSLVNLNALHLAHNQIVDVSFLSSLTQLEVLHLEHNQVTDVSSLSTLTSMTEASVWDNSIKSIDALAELPSLEKLDVSNNEISALPVVGFPHLKILNVSSNPVEDISTVWNYTELHTFTAYYTPLQLPAPAQLSQSMAKIFIGSDDYTREDRMDSLSWIVMSPNLEELHADGFPISSLEGVEVLTHLRVLDVGGGGFPEDIVSPGSRKIADLGPVAGLLNLERLELARNTDITDLSPLTALNNIWYFDCSYCGLTDLSPLASLANLRHVDVSRNVYLEDLSGLENLPLDLVDLFETLVTDFSILANNPNFGPGDRLYIGGYGKGYGCESPGLTELDDKGVILEYSGAGIFHCPP